MIHIENYSEACYKVEYDVKEASIDVKAWRITAFSPDLSHFDVEEDIALSGYIKSDGCMEFDYNAHYCSLYHAKQFYLLIEEIYKFREMHFGKN